MKHLYFLVSVICLISGCASSEPPPGVRGQAREALDVANEFCPDVAGRRQDDNCATPGECTIVEAEITVDKTTGDPAGKWVRFCLFEGYTAGDYYLVSGNYKWANEKFKANKYGPHIEKIRWCFPHVRSPGCIFFQFTDRSGWVGMGLKIWVWRRGQPESEKQLVFAGTRAENSRTTEPGIKGFTPWVKTRIHPAVHYANDARLIMYFGRKKILEPFPEPTR